MPKRRKRRWLLKRVDEGRKVGGQTSECMRALRPVKIDPAYSTLFSPCIHKDMVRCISKQ